jgi:hypothetical protein
MASEIFGKGIPTLPLHTLQKPAKHRQDKSPNKLGEIPL